MNMNIMLQPKTNLLRLSSIVLLLIMLFVCLTPLTVFADDTKDNTDQSPVFYAEASVVRADTTECCTAGFHLYVKNPDALPLTLTYQIYKSDTPDSVIAATSGDHADWILVTPVEQTAGTDTPHPAFTFGFHKPADISVEDPDFMTLPDFLRPVTVGGEVIYTLDPACTISFRVTGGDAAVDGTYALDETLTCTPDAPSFMLERPQKLIVNLIPGTAPTEESTPEEKDTFHSGSISTYFYLPESIRTILSALKTEKDSFLSSISTKEKTITDASVYVQYDFTTLDTPSTYNAEAEADGNALWSTANLYAIDPASDSIVCSAGFSFDSESFRSCFPEGTFDLSQTPVDPQDGAPEIILYQTMDPEKVTLTTRVRFILALTDADGTVTYHSSVFTDPNSCGASNSLVSAPTSMDAPVLSDAVFESSESGKTTLKFHVTANDSIREAAVWLAANQNTEGVTDQSVGAALEISVNGNDWEPVDAAMFYNGGILLDGDWSFSVTDESLNDYAYIRVRMRYTAQVSADAPLQSEWSAALAFDKKPETVVPTPESENTLPLYSDTSANAEDIKYVCPICGICPAPYGICLFLWIGAALLLVLLVVLIIALIPKKKICPRCKESCRTDDKTCPVCGYRFVGSMPEIEDTTENLMGQEAENAHKEPSDEDFFAAMSAKEGTNTNKSTGSVPAAPRQTAANAPGTAAHIPLPEADPVFLAELKRKLTAVKAGQPQSFTPAEIAYIKALKEKKAQSNAAVSAKTAASPTVTAAQPRTGAASTGQHSNAAAKRPVSSAAPDANEKTTVFAKTDLHTVTSPVPPSKDSKPKTAAETYEEKAARLRALRAKQLAEEDALLSSSKMTGDSREMRAKPTPTSVAHPAQDIRAAAPKKVEKPVRQIKCPACAVPNPETNERCYICGGLLPKNNPHA